MEDNKNKAKVKDANTNTSSTSPVEEMRKCVSCKRTLPLSKFDRFGSHGYHRCCKACEGKDCGNDERFKDVTSRDLILELKARGYKGKLQKVTIEDVVI